MSEEKVETKETENTTVEKVKLSDEQLAEVKKAAESRAERAEKSVIKSYLEQHGISEDEAPKLFEFYKSEKSKTIPEEARKILDEEKKKLEVERNSVNDQLTKANKRLALAEIKGMTDYNSKLVEKLIDWSTIEVDDDGNVKGIDEQVTTLEKEFPEIKKQARQTSANPANEKTTDTLDEYNKLMSDYRKTGDHMLLQKIAILKSKLKE